MQQNPEPRVSVIMAVHNGAPWLRPVLDALFAQTYPNIEVTVRNNASTDATANILREHPRIARVINDAENIGVWAGFERTLSETTGNIVVLLTDVVLDPAFIATAVRAFQRHPNAGALQAKVLQMRWENGTTRKTNLIDCTGFAVSRARRVTNRGQGETDAGQYDHEEEIFAVEGAVPVFRRSALEASRIQGHLIDPDYRRGPIGYGDDFDLAWRMHLFGFTQLYVPTMLAWHARSTTTDTARLPVIGQLGRLRARRAIALQKRRLDWSNVRFTILKNDCTINILRDAPFILAREIAVQGYALLFEPRVLAEWGRFIRLLPRMLRRRRAVMVRARLTAAQMHAFFA